MPFLEQPMHAALWQLCLPLLASVLQAASAREAWEGRVSLLLAIVRAPWEPTIVRVQLSSPCKQARAPNLYAVAA